MGRAQTAGLILGYVAVACGACTVGPSLVLDECHESASDAPSPPPELDEVLREHAWVATYYYEYTWVDPSDTTGIMVAELNTFDGQTSCLKIVVHAPGASDHQVGDTLCEVCGELQLMEVDGFDGLERQKFYVVETEDTCGFDLVGVEEAGVITTLTQDEQSFPILLGRWRTRVPTEDLPTDGFYYENGTVEPDLVCPYGAAYGEAGCAATCYWGPGTGPDCPTLAEVVASNPGGFRPAVRIGYEEDACGGCVAAAMSPLDSLASALVMTIVLATHVRRRSRR